MRLVKKYMIKTGYMDNDGTMLWDEVLYDAIIVVPTIVVALIILRVAEVL